MGKIDIISLTGLTSIDGSEILSGATIKFETVFHVGTTNVEIRLKVYRSRALFEQGYRPVGVVELPNDFILEIPEEEFYTITPSILFTKVVDSLNNIVGENSFEIKIIED